MDRRLPLCAAALLLVGLAAGCGSSSSGGDGTTQPSATVTVTDSATPTPTPSVTPSESPSASPSPTAPSGPVACRTAGLKASIGGGEGAAGSTFSTITLTNTGSVACVIRGYGGVSYVGGEAGVQVGAPATRDTTTAVTRIVLQPGQRASAQLQEGEALNYPKATCRPAKAEGLKIFPPNETEALFVRHPTTACSSSAVKLLQLQAYVKAG